MTNSTVDNSGLISDALQKTNEDLWKLIDAQNSYKETIRVKGLRVSKYRDYERGDHDANMTNQIRSMLRIKEDGSKLNELTSNYVKIVVDKMAGRIFVDGLTTDTEQGNEWIEDLKIHNSFDKFQGTVHRAAVREGDSYVMVTANEDLQTVDWTSEPAYDGFSGIVCIFSEDNIPLWACKLWSESRINFDDSDENVTYETFMKITVYQDDSIKRFTGSVGGETVMAVPDGEDENRLGKIPLIHFANARDNYTSYGEGEVRVVIPLQNILNRTLYSMTMASELTAFKIYVAKGIPVDTAALVPGALINMNIVDENGNIIVDPTDAQAKLLESAGITELGEADMSQYISQIQKLVQEISQTTQTPIYGVTVEGNLSGEALKQLEIGLLGKVERFQRENTDAWRRVVIMSKEIQDTFAGAGSSAVFDSVNVSWKSGELLNVAERITSLLDIRSNAPGLFSDDFYRQKIGDLLLLGDDEIQKESDKVAGQQASFFDTLSGGAGNIPAVIA